MEEETRSPFLLKSEKGHFHILTVYDLAMGIEEKEQTDFGTFQPQKSRR